ncbi:PREDICTED: uncharacterized protein LOC106557363 [Thamnophis sirtalis]|uniref:Uncharacterized protein LOC106557363 n=1 Tax=Thamnophis sirtalis TaxID=35019 RepID=A0A6I9Z4M8_9SAUR|nr:PREDICTED: uncharacterized protein LOC106557363 [Thamnophis sirtalis]
MPLTARQLLVEQNPDYPSLVPPGYRASPCRHHHLPWVPWLQTQSIHCTGVCGSNTHFPPWSFCCPLQHHSTSPMSSTWAEDTLVPRVSPSKEEASKKLEDQPSKGRPPTLENDKDAKGDRSKLKKETNVADAKSWEEVKVSEPSEDQKGMDSEDTRNNAGTMVDIVTNAGFLQPNVSGSSTQLSQRNTSQKTYLANNSKLQAKLDWVNKSLKKDRVAIESVLHMRRSYSAPPSGQKLLEKGTSRDGPREVDANPAKIDFKRQKWEQRQLRKEEQQQEIHLKREMRLENKRHF